MVDLDGVVWDIMHVFVEIHNGIYHRDVKYEDVNDWWFFPQDEFETVYPLTLPRIMDYPVTDHYVDTYIYSLNISHDVSILTAELNSKEVLKKKLDSIGIFEKHHYDKIIKVDPNNSKFLGKLDYEADVYIDDNPNMADKMHEYPDRYLLLYNQAWNQSFEDEKSDNVWRVFDWDEIKTSIDLIRIRKRNLGL